MNYEFSVALDRPAAVRHMEAVAGDDFTVAVSIYENDGLLAMANLAGATTTLSLERACGADAEVTGSNAAGVATFDLSGVDLAPLVGRNVWRVTLARAGKSVAAVRGILTVTR